MPTNTYVPLGTASLSGTKSATFSLSGITGYTDLIVTFSGSCSTGNLLIRFNGDSSTLYSQTDLKGIGTSTSSTRETTQSAIYFGDYVSTPISTWSIATAQINNYANSNINKTAILRTSNSTKTSQIAVGTYRTTAAITSITVATDGANNFDSGSTVSLYGITAIPANPTAKATGGLISFGSDGYTYHTFKSSGTFTPTTNISADILVIAGGGAGGVVGVGGGGGGAGGLQGFTAQSLTATGYTVTVGAGGASTAYTTSNHDGLPGSNSQFGALTASIGGGGGAGWQGRNGLSGGSGGGAGGTSSTGSVGGSGTAGQGNSGGNGTTGSSNSAWLAGGGGGGAGSAGQSGSGSGVSGGTPYIAGKGGDGSFAYASWALQTGTGVGGYYAGGGGSAAMNGPAKSYSNGGLGGGGSSRGNNSSSADGVINTGSGGACDKNDVANPTTGPGGSGIVIIRYAS